MRIAVLALLLGALPSCSTLGPVLAELEAARAETQAAVEQISEARQEIKDLPMDDPARAEQVERIEGEIDRIGNSMTGVLESVGQVAVSVAAYGDLIQQGQQAGKDIVGSLADGFQATDALTWMSILGALFETYRRSKKAAVEQVHRERDEARKKRNEVTGETLARAAPPMADKGALIGSVLELLPDKEKATKWLEQNPPPLPEVGPFF